MNEGRNMTKTQTNKQTNKKSKTNQQQIEAHTLVSKMIFQYQNFHKRQTGKNRKAVSLLRIIWNDIASPYAKASEHS